MMALVCFSCHSTPSSDSPPPSHQLWDQLLKAHVDKEGKVDYPGFIREMEKLQEYLNLLSEKAPDPDRWTEAEQLAYWINAYNAFTVKLIADNYPVESIRDLDPTLSIPMVRTVWHKKFFSIGGKPMNLDQIEHKVLRKEFEEPRIHFAINCASYSCPPLRVEAYVAENLEEQLEEQARWFINHPRWNNMGKDKIEISAIFNWFKGDFTKKGNLIAYLNRYSEVQIRENAKVEYLKYDWGLNE
nr:DUF547 domain-containing protein [Pleomorphovibrio marinus]